MAQSPGLFSLSSRSKGGEGRKNPRNSVTPEDPPATMTFDLRKTGRWGLLAGPLFPHTDRRHEAVGPVAGSRKEKLRTKNGGDRARRPMK